MAHKIEAELGTFKVKRKDGEDDQSYFRRLFEKANTCTDDQWKALSEDTQKWVNAASAAVEEGNTIPNFDGEVVEATAETSETADEDTMATKKEKGAAKSKAGAKKGGAAKAAAKTVNKGAVGRKGTYPLDAKITVKVKDNPHRESSKDYNKFKGLKTGMTVEKALAAGADWGYLRYAAGRELIAVG